jgi:hypothetical protein
MIINAALFCSVKPGKEILQLVGGFQNFSGAFFIQLPQTSQMQQGGLLASAGSFREQVCLFPDRQVGVGSIAQQRLQDLRGFLVDDCDHIA